MPRELLIAALVALLIAGSLRAEPSASQQTKPHVLSGKVVSIADGDTLTVLDASNNQHKIRLEGIDAPERRQDYGDKSRQALAAKVFGKEVAVKWREKDRYGDILGQVQWLKTYYFYLKRHSVGIICPVFVLLSILFAIFYVLALRDKAYALSQPPKKFKIVDKRIIRREVESAGGVRVRHLRENGILHSVGQLWGDFCEQEKISSLQSWRNL